MVYYYKLNVGTLEKFIDQIGRLDFVGVWRHIGRIILEDQNWVRDDVDYPEAVEAAEIMAFGYNQEWEIDESRCDGYRWVTSECLGRIVDRCHKQDPDVVGIITTLINHSPYPDAEYHNIED